MRKFCQQMLFVSDIHLLSPHDSRGTVLLDLISRVDTSKVEYFVLGGDIFDFCFGASAYFKTKFRKIGEALEELAANGTRVIFVQGNHEFALEELGWVEIDFVTERSRTFELSCGTRISVTHGDRLFLDWSYKIYISITRSHIFKWAALALPQRYLDRFALYCSRRSRMRGHSQELNHRRVVAAAEHWIKDQGSQVGLFGHFHYPYDSNVASFETKARVLSVDSWHQPNVLAFTGGEVERITLDLS